MRVHTHQVVNLGRLEPPNTIRGVPWQQPSTDLTPGISTLPALPIPPATPAPPYCRPQPPSSARVRGQHRAALPGGRSHPEAAHTEVSCGCRP